MPEAKPNILFILADDMGYGDFGAFNRGLSNTPVLDALMGESLCLTQQYTASPVCNPSRAALMTGRYPHRTGSIDTLEWRGLDRLALREVTIADLLQRAGYVTGITGKWHLGAFDPRYHPNRRGFDEAVCFRGGMHDYYNWRLEYNQDVHRADGRYLTDLFTEEAVAFIRRHRARPFFLTVTYNAPHTPLQVPEEELRPFTGQGRFTRGVSCVYGMIRRLDKGVGRLLEALREEGLEDNTLVAFTSDNGPQFGGEGEDCLDRFNCQFRGAKGLVFEGGIRVPFLLRWPGRVRPGTLDSMVHFCDWFPTLLAAAGVEAPRDRPIDGVNVLPLLTGDKGQVQTVRYWQWNRLVPVVTSNAAMRDGDWKLVRPRIAESMYVGDKGQLEKAMYHPEHFIENGLVRDTHPRPEIPPPPPALLFNLARDPLETTDLASREPDRARRMLRSLENWFEEVEAERATINDAW